MKIYTYEGKANISGDRIHQARTAQRLSQDALAAKLQLAGLSIGREAVSRIETGLRFVTDYELVIFARVLGVTIEWLTGDIHGNLPGLTVDLPANHDNFFHAQHRPVPLSYLFILGVTLRPGASFRHSARRIITVVCRHPALLTRVSTRFSV